MKKLLSGLFILGSISSFAVLAQDQSLNISIKDIGKIGAISALTDTVSMMDKIYLNETTKGNGTYLGISEIIVDEVALPGTIYNDHCSSNLTVKFKYMHGSQIKVDTVELKGVYSQFSCDYLTDENAVLFTGQSGLSGEGKILEKVVYSTLNVEKDSTQTEYVAHSTTIVESTDQ